MANPQTQGSESITQAEHISPAKTGDNIEAKKVALYVDDGNSNGNWVRMTQPSITTGDVTVEGTSSYSDSGGVERRGLVDADRHVQTDVLSSALPTGAATAANQQTDALTDTELRATPVVVDLGANNDVTVTGTVTANLSATDNAVLDDIAANQTDNSQKTQIVDSSGNAVTVTGNKLDVNASVSTTGLATDSKQDEQTALLTTIEANQLPDGHNVTIDNASIAVTGTFFQATQPVSGTVTANLGATDNAVLDQIELNQDSQTTLLTAIDADTSDIHTNSDTIAAGFAAEGAALGSGVLIQGDDGTDRTNVLVDTAGHLQVDVLSMPAGGSGLTDAELRASPVPVDLGANNDVTVTGTVTANLSATDNAVLDQIELNQDAQTALLTTIDADTGSLSTDIDSVMDTVESTILGTHPVLDTRTVLFAQKPNEDYTNINATAGGNLKVSVEEYEAALPAGDNNIGNVDVASSVLPTGAATSAKQDTIIGHVDGIETLLGTIDGDTSAMVTDLAAIETLLTTIESNQLPDSHNVTIDNTVTVDLGANNDVTVTSGTVTAELSAVDNAVLDTIDAVLDTIKVDTEAIETAVEALQAGQLPDGHNVTVDNASIAVTGTFWQATQPVSGTVTANLSATDNAVLDSIDTAVNAKRITGIGHGVTTVTTAGTDVALAGSTACKKVTIQAQTDNTSAVAIGGSGVDATVATGSGVLLFPGDSFELEIDNLADVFVDSLVNGEGVRYVYFT